jgi:hypothetical protein
LLTSCRTPSINHSQTANTSDEQGEEEWPLDFPVGPGSRIDVLNAGDDLAVNLPVLFGELL